MSLIRLNSYSIPAQNLADGNYTIRYYYNFGFIDSAGQPVQSGTATTGTQIRGTATVADGFLTSEDVQIYTTVDAQSPFPQSINLSCQVFKGNSALPIYPFQQSGCPSSWIIYNPYPNDFWELNSLTFLQQASYPAYQQQWMVTNQEMIAYVNSLATVPNASLTVKGKSRLSASPSNSNDPVAWGANDQRLLALLTASQVNAKQQYAASGVYDTTTTTGNNLSGVSLISIDSSATFEEGHGVYIAGAGVGGEPYVGTVTEVASATTIQVTPAISTTVTTGTLVQHDDSAAINAAIAAVVNAGGGTVFLPAGWYRCNGPLDATTKSIITYPQVDYYVAITGVVTKIGVKLLGEPINTSAYPFAGLFGTVIDAEQASQGTVSGTLPAMLAPHVHESTATDLATFNGIGVTIENIMFSVSVNPKLSGLRLNNVPSAIITNCSVMVNSGQTNAGITEPTNLSAGVILPGINNDSHVTMSDVFIQGMKIGLDASEHAHLANVQVRKCHTGLVVEPGYFHIWGDMVIEQCGTMIEAGAANTARLDLTVRAERNDLEAGQWYGKQTYDVPDPGNLLTGQVRYSLALSSEGKTTLGLNKQGGANVTLVPIYAMGQPTLLTNNMSGTLADGVVTAVGFNVEIKDLEDQHDNLVNITRITYADAAARKLMAIVTFEPSGIGLRAVQFRINGITTLLNQVVAPVAGEQTRVVAYYPYHEFAAGDYVEVIITQSSGGPLDVTAGSIFCSERVY